MVRERHKIAILVAEFLGTAVLTLLAWAVTFHANNPYFIALGLGLGLTALTLVFGNISGAHFNPAITIGMLTSRRVKPAAAIVYLAAQLLGGVVGYTLFAYLTNNHVKNHTYFDSRVLVSEAVGAFIFALGWAAVVYNNFTNAKAAVITGSSFAVGILVASFVATGVINPAIALGLHTWVWGTYALGPVLGAAIGFNLYAILFAPAEALLAGEKVLHADADVDAPQPVVGVPLSRSKPRKKRK